MSTLWFLGTQNSDSKSVCFPKTSATGLNTKVPSTQLSGNWTLICISKILYTLDMDCQRGDVFRIVPENATQSVQVPNNWVPLEGIYKSI